MKEKNKSWVLFVLKLAVGLGLLTLLIFREDSAGEIGNLLLGLPIDYVLFLCALSLFSRLLSTYKWKVLLDAQRSKVSLYQLFRYTLIGQFFSNFLPGMIGGDITKIYFLSRRVESMTRSVGSVFLERFTGLSALILLVLCFSIVNYQLMLIPMVGASVGIVVLMAIAMAIALALGNQIFELASPLNSIPIVRRSLVLMQNLHREIMSYKGHHFALLLAVVYSLGIYFVASISMYISCLAVDVQLSFLTVSMITPLVYLVATIPVTPNNIGWWEWCVTLFLGEFDVSLAQSVTVALLMRVIVIVISLLGGIFFVTEKTGSISRTVKQIQSENRFS